MGGVVCKIILPGSFGCGRGYLLTFSLVVTKTAAQGPWPFGRLAVWPLASVASLRFGGVGSRIDGAFAETLVPESGRR